MNLERMAAGTCERPFPVYEDLVEKLVGAHTSVDEESDLTAAHVMAVCSGYAYADIETMTTIVTRLGLEAHACACIAQSVDAMFVYSTAHIVQSRCGRVVILCYRGTETSNLSNWLGDADVGSDSMLLGEERLRVHSGFYRNVRATRWSVIRELNLALEGRSLADPRARVDHPLEALYVTGHSLGGAMAVLFSLSVMEHRTIAEKLRAVYTFGQPLVAGEPMPATARNLAPKLYRYIMAHDPIPALPARAGGPLVHFGREYRYAGGKWERAAASVIQMKSMHTLPPAVLALIGVKVKGPGSRRYTLVEHGPHLYVAALRPEGRITEYGDEA
jgi:lipase (class 3)